MDQLKVLEHIGERLYGKWCRHHSKSVWQVIESEFERAAKEWDPVFAQGRKRTVAEEEAIDDGSEELMQTLSCGAKPDPEQLKYQLPPDLNEDAVVM